MGTRSVGTRQRRISDLEVVRVSLPTVAFGEGWRETLQTSFEHEENSAAPLLQQILNIQL